LGGGGEKGVIKKATSNQRKKATRQRLAISSDEQKKGVRRIKGGKAGGRKRRDGFTTQFYQVEGRGGVSRFEERKQSKIPGKDPQKRKPRKKKKGAVG